MSENPTSNEMRLFSQNGYNLVLRASGEVAGSECDDDPETRIRIISGGDVSLVRIQGYDHDLCVCFDEDGNLYGEDESSESTLFEEHFLGSYTVYKSVKYPNWFIGIKKSGLAKNGNKTKFDQKAVKFLPRRF